MRALAKLTKIPIFRKNIGLILFRRKKMAKIQQFSEKYL